METFIIAEAGVNHNGSLATAIEMVRRAAEAGADAVKFQTFRAEDTVTASAPKAEYQNAGDRSDSQYAMLKKLELEDEAFAVLADECRRCGVEFMSTPFSLSAARLLETLGMRYWKIPSGEITNRPLLEYVGSVAPKVIMSTGMCEMSEIEDALAAVTSGGIGRDDIYLLHCTTAYPTPADRVNLRAMDALRSFGTAGVGYSDHTEGIVIPVAAVALGATIIEKHFTLDRDMPGPDHRASLTPDMLALMVTDIRTVSAALGDGTKRRVDIEAANMAAARKSLVACRPITRGEVFTADNITSKRPGTGLSPMLLPDLLGRTAKHNYLTDQQILNDELT